jgi:hypothetical protein
MRASDAKLAAALHEAGLAEMAKRAEAGYYNEFFGPLDFPELTLADDLLKAGTTAALALRRRVIDGEFDAGTEESEEWAGSPQGQDAMRRLIRGE